MNITTRLLETVNPSFERVQIQGLTRIALLLSSLAAIPGFFGSLYLFAIIANELTPSRTFTAHNWLYFGPLLVAMIAGWWLYVTYWLELNSANRYGKVSWFVSAFVNAILALYPLIDLRSPEHTNTLFNIILLAWLLTMVIISARVWVLKMRKTR